MGLGPFPAGGRRTLSLVQYDCLTAAESQKARQLLGVGVTRQPRGAAADVQRQRRPGEKAARLALAEEGEASFDLYPNFEVRGREFKSIVNALK